MASRALAARREAPDDYARSMAASCARCEQPVILHWLGEMFDPALEGYWGQPTHDAAMDVCLDVIAAHADKVDGIKISLLSKEKEIAMRRRLPAGVRMYTGDDFNYAELIAGDEQGHSRRAARHLRRHRAGRLGGAGGARPGNDNEFFELLEPTVPLSRHIFAAPTRFYKTGVVFLAYLNGLQDPFRHDRRPAERRARCSIWPNCSGSPTRRACSRARTRAGGGRMQRVLAVHGSGREHRCAGFR